MSNVKTKITHKPININQVKAIKNVITLNGEKWGLKGREIKQLNTGLNRYLYGLGTSTADSRDGSFLTRVHPRSVRAWSFYSDHLNDNKTSLKAVIDRIADRPGCTKLRREVLLEVLEEAEKALKKKPDTKLARQVKAGLEHCKKNYVGIGGITTVESFKSLVISLFFGVCALLAAGTLGYLRSFIDDDAIIGYAQSVANDLGITA